MAVAASGEPRFAAGIPARIIDGPYFIGGPYRSYDISRDGRRFLMIKPDRPVGSPSGGTIVVVQNWADELQRLLPRD